MRGDIPILQNAIASLQRNYAETYKRMYELNTAQQKEIDDLKKVILTLLPQVKSLEKRIDSILGENIEKYIDEWLDNHKQEIIDAIGEGVFVPWKVIKNADGTEAQAGTPIYTKDAVDLLLGNKVNKSDVYTKNEVDSKLNNKVNLSQIDDGSSPADLLTKVYSTSQTYSKNEADTKYMPKTTINTIYQESDHDGELYSVGYINSLISDNPADKSHQTYTAEKIEERIVKVGDDKWIKRAGNTAINNVILTPADNDDSKLTLQLKGTTSEAGTIYVPNVQGWKAGDWN